MENEQLKRINIVIVAAYFIASLLASLGFAFKEAKLMFYMETLLGLSIYIIGVIAAYRNYKLFKHNTLFILMIAGIILSFSLIALML